MLQSVTLNFFMQSVIRLGVTFLQLCSVSLCSLLWHLKRPTDKPGNTKGGSITVQLTSCLTSLDQSVLQIKTKIVIHHTAISKPVKQEVNGTVMLPPLVYPAQEGYSTLNPMMGVQIPPYTGRGKMAKKYMAKIVVMALHQDNGTTHSLDFY